MIKAQISTIDEEFDLVKSESIEEVAKDIVSQVNSDKKEGGKPKIWDYIDSYTSHVHEGLSIGERAGLNQKIFDKIKSIKSKEKKQVWTRTKGGKLETVHRRRGTKPRLHRPKGSPELYSSRSF